MTELETLRSKLFTANAMQFAIRAERDALKKDLAEAQETISAVRKRAEHAERERDEAREGSVGCCPRKVWGDGEHDLNCPLQISLARVKELESQNADLDEEVANNDAERDEALEKLAASEARCRALEGMLGKANTRLEILAGRMRACDEHARQKRQGEDGHELSLFEIGGWVEEQRAALAQQVQDAAILRFCNKCGACYRGPPEHPPCHYLAPEVPTIEQDARNLDAVGPAREAPSAGREQRETEYVLAPDPYDGVLRKISRTEAEIQNPSLAPTEERGTEEGS